MRITKWGEYGVLLSLYIAKIQSDGAIAVGAKQIAEAQGITVQYAQQILSRLRRGSILMARRGRLGGFTLARPPAEISINDILVAVEGEAFHLFCDTTPLDPHNRCTPERDCVLRNVWRDFKREVNRYFSNWTLQDLLQSESKSFHVISLPSSDIQIGEKKTCSHQCSRNTPTSQPGAWAAG